MNAGQTGGPIVAALGARGTLLTSGLATIALGLISTAVLARAHARKTRAGQAGAPKDRTAA